MNKSTLITIFLLITVKVIFSQTITVKDNSTQKPLPNVALWCSESNIYTTTNINGKANISDFTSDFCIEISCLGYETVSSNLEELKQNNYNISLYPSILNMDEVIVSVTRWNQHSHDTPSTTISIKPRDIKLQTPQTSADLLSVSGKVFIQKSQQGGGSPMIRGFATNRLLYAVDGVRMNSAIFRSGNLQNVISLDPFTFEKTEVLFGPGSVIYGSDAIGGVMIFNTKAPQFGINNKMLISGNSNFRYSTVNQEKTAHTDINIGSQKIAALSSISYTKFGDLKMGSHGPDDYLRKWYVSQKNNIDTIINNEDELKQISSGYNQLNLMQKLRYKPNNQWDLKLGYHYSTTSDYDRYDRLLQTKKKLPKYGDWHYGPQRWQMGLIDIINKNSNYLYTEVELRLAYQYFEESRIKRKFKKTKQTTRTEKVDAWSINLDLYKTINEHHKLFYGTEWVLNNVNSKGVNKDIISQKSSSTSSRYPNSDWLSYGVYITEQYKISKPLTLQGGLRFSLYEIKASFNNSKFPFKNINNKNNALTGSLGLVYKPVNNFVINLNGSTAYRAPNVDDMGKIFDSEPGNVVVPNPDLKSEYAYNLDLGFAAMINQSLKFDMTGYYTHLKDALVRRDFSFNGKKEIMYDGELSQVQAIQNAAFADIMGIQLGVEIRLRNGLGFSSNLNFQDGTEELDNGTKSPSRHVPPAFGNLKVNYNKNKLFVEIYNNFNLEKSFNQMAEGEKNKAYIYAKDNNGKPYAPAWSTLNLKSQYQFNKNLSLGLGLENILDTRYKPYSSGIAAGGRNFVFSLNLQF